MTSGKYLQTKLYYAVSGGRGYRDYAHVKRVLDEERPGVVVQGECPTKDQGADGLAKRWCRETGTPCLGMEALWDFYGRPAGPIRNGWMFDFLPIYKLIAFPGDKGTNDAVTQAYEREICVRDERDSGPKPNGRDREDGLGAKPEGHGARQRNRPTLPSQTPAEESNND